MAYYDDEPNAGLDWYDAEVKRHAATKADLARVTAERDAAQTLVAELRHALRDLRESVTIEAKRTEIELARASGETAALAAEVEAMRAGVSSAEAIANAKGSFTHYLNALRLNLDALRSRKVGG